MKMLNIKGKCEAAFRRVLEQYAATQELSGFQWVYRFFAGKLKPKRISVVCGTPVVATRDEDLTTCAWEVPIVIEVVTDKRALTGEEHDELVATIAEAIYDGADTCADLNAAMTGEGFNALVWTYGDGPEDDVIDDLRKSKLQGRLMMMPAAAPAS